MEIGDTCDSMAEVIMLSVTEFDGDEVEGTVGC